jgi:branched-chain amino acid transport system ATP-binding protein
MMLEVAGLAGGYKTLEVLHGIDLELAPGRALALLGPNAAGKTTLLRALSGVLPRTRGTITLEGLPIDGLRGHARVAAGLVQVPEGRGLFRGLTVGDHLAVCALPKDAGRELVPYETLFELFPVLAERMRQRAGTLSGGEQQMLAIARALRLNPRVLLLDEPSSGLAPVVVEQLFATLETIKRRGVAILLVEQQAAAALELADDVAILAEGRVVFSRPRAHTSVEDVAGAYLQTAVAL